MRVVTFNIRHARGLDNRCDIRRVAETLAALQPDFAALQEVACFRPDARFQHQPRQLSRQLHMHRCFAPAWRLGPIRYGNLLLSKQPPITCSAHRLPHRGEPRVLLEAHFDRANGDRFALFATHLGLSSTERAQQAESIASQITQCGLPAILCLDANDEVTAPCLQPLLHVLQDVGLKDTPSLATFPADRPQHRIDLILATPHWQVEKVEVGPAGASDHLPLCVALTEKS
ncbi:MAG: endonuclease/exonuclease/phosphatase family protein [Firmicutes bacterium]|nr:endonuclease/exonuclease/phosphatase family protein [Bacillota bacterium]